MEYEGYMMKKDRGDDVMFFASDLYGDIEIIRTRRNQMSPLQRRLVLESNPFNKRKTNGTVLRNNTETTIRRYQEKRGSNRKTGETSKVLKQFAKQS